jgi:nucleotide-binding universal stress UspA family protein
MTSHGRTGLSRAWLGSVADGLIRQASVPVLLLRPVDTEAKRVAAHRLFASLLVPLDGSSRSARILEPAIALAKCSGARLSLLRVVEPVPSLEAEAGFPYGYMPTLTDERATQSVVAAAKDGLESIAADLRRDTGLEVSADVVVDGSLGRGILEYANAHGNDLIALATRGRGASRLFLGSVADKVLRGSERPMLVYRPDAEPAE